MILVKLESVYFNNKNNKDDITYNPQDTPQWTVEDYLLMRLN